MALKPLRNIACVVFIFVVMISSCYQVAIIQPTNSIDVKSNNFKLKKDLGWNDYGHHHHHHHHGWHDYDGRYPSVLPIYVIPNPIYNTFDRRPIYNSYNRPVYKRNN